MGRSHTRRVESQRVETFNGLRFPVSPRTLVERNESEKLTSEHPRSNFDRLSLTLLMKTSNLISRRQLLKSASLAALLPTFLAVTPVACRAQAPAQPTAPHPNIVLVLSDDQSARFVGCYGDDVIRTPNVDRAAAQGVRFSRAYTTSPQCVPSRASIMTGRSAVAINMTRFSAPLPMEYPSYPELLRSGANYYTGLCGRSFHLDGADGHKVLDTLDLRTFNKRVDYLRKVNFKPNSDAARAETLGQAREFLDQVPAGRPFFLQVGYSDPHRPFDADAVAQPYDPSKLKLPAWMPDTPALRQDLARYYGEVTRVDSDFGDVLKELDKRGLRNNTVVVYMGDNGAALLRGKGTLYNTGLHVPLVVSGPGIARGAVSDEMISGEDIFPTFLEIAGVPVPKQITGRSFLPILRGQQLAPRPYVFAERGAHASNLPGTSNVFDLSRCVISPTHKLIYNATAELPYSPTDFNKAGFWNGIQKMNDAGKLDEPFSRIYFPNQRPQFELYDLKNDPGELNNLYGTKENQAVEDELKTALQRHMAIDRDYLPLPIVNDGKYFKIAGATADNNDDAE